MRALRVAALAVLSAGPAVAQENPLEPKEFIVPWASTRPRDPIMDQVGRVWFVGQQGNYVAYLDPKTGQFKQYTIDAGTNPHNINIDERGGVWYTGNRNSRIVQLIPETGELKTHMMPDPTVRDPHTMIWGKDGIAWFTAQGSQRIGRFDRKTGEIKLWRPPHDSPTDSITNPYGVVLASDGTPYFNLFQSNKIATIDPKTLQYKEFVHPDVRMRARRIAITSDDQIYFGDYRGVLNHLDPKTGKFEEFPLPAGNGKQAYAHAQDDQDRIWLVDVGVQPNKMHVFDTKSKSFVAEIPILSNGASRNTIRHMTYNKATRELWFGTDAGTIGKINVPKDIRKLTP
ncbi:MAG: virginiamycin B lyase family protein [Gemmatimonadaceae bacterium]